MVNNVSKILSKLYELYCMVRFKAHRVLSPFCNEFKLTWMLLLLKPKVINHFIHLLLSM